jgi:hypothetical protein
MTVLEASALLAFLQGEKGAEVVEEGLVSGAACGTANWSEVAQKIQANGGTGRWPAPSWPVTTSGSRWSQPATPSKPQRPGPGGAGCRWPTGSAWRSVDGWTCRC